MLCWHPEGRPDDPENHGQQGDATAGDRGAVGPHGECRVQITGRGLHVGDLWGVARQLRLATVSIVGVGHEELVAQQLAELLTSTSVERLCSTYETRKPVPTDVMATRAATTNITRSFEHRRISGWCTAGRQLNDPLFPMGMSLSISPCLVEFLSDSGPCVPAHVREWQMAAPHHRNKETAPEPSRDAWGEDRWLWLRPWPAPRSVALRVRFGLAAYGRDHAVHEPWGRWLPRARRPYVARALPGGKAWR